MRSRLPRFLKKLKVDTKTLGVAAAGIAVIAFIEANGGNGVSHLPPENDLDYSSNEIYTQPKPRASACLINRDDVYQNRCDEPIKVFICLNRVPEGGFVRSRKMCDELRISAQESFTITKEINQEIGACYTSQDMRVEIGGRDYTCG